MWGNIVIIYTLIVLSVTGVDAQACGQAYEVPVSAIAESRLENKAFITISTSTISECAGFCQRYPGCGTINYHTVDRVCELNPGAVESDTYDQTPGWLFTDVATHWPQLDVLKGCKTNPCHTNSGCYEHKNVGVFCSKYTLP